jgi:hypothetical protein
MTRPLVRTLASLPVLLLLASQAPVQAFEIHRHALMTRSAMQQAGVSGAALGSVMLGAMWPDAVGCLLYAYCDPPYDLDRTPPTAERVLSDLSLNHFDNDQLEPSIERVHDRMRRARDLWQGLAASPNPWPEEDARDFHRAMFEFGQALHAIQDFYAHSTYLECNVPLLRIGCSRDLAIWNGLRVGGCDPSYTVDGVGDLQSGYYKVAPPPGSTTHEALNKDHGGTSQGSRTVTRLFPPSQCYSYYGVVSGQFSSAGATDPYESSGIALRHSEHALQALNGGGPVFGSLLVDFAAQTDAVGESLFDLIDRANADPAVIALAEEIAGMVDPTNPDPHAFPLDALDLDGLPLPEPALGAALGLGALGLRCAARRRLRPRSQRPRHAGRGRARERRP